MNFVILMEVVDSVEKLKCKICKNFLSYFPIQVSDHGKNICGRCNQVDNQHRNEAYEAVAQYIQFPCRYEGCEKKVVPKDMPHHENNCLYKMVKCPILKSTRCKWEGSFVTALQHCKDEHSGLFLKNSCFIIDPTCSQAEDLMEFKHGLLLVSRKFDPLNDIFQCSICHIEDGMPLKNFVCKVVTADKTMALWNKCDASGLAEIPLKLLKRGHNCRIAAKIVVEEPDNGSSVHGTVNEEMISQLKCSVCSEYALPPIYHDEDNKVKCSTCNEDTSSSGNSTLDNLVSLLYYPCKYRENGCSSVLKPEEMKKHQKFCRHGSGTCPVNEYVKCEWIGLRKDIWGHLQGDHLDMIKDNCTDITEHYTPDIFTKCYIIKLDGGFFKLVFSVDEAKQQYDEENDAFVEVHRYFRWTVQMIGHPRDDLMYEIEINDSNNRGRRLLARQLCQPLSKHEELFTNDDDHCNFSFDQTRTLVTKNNKIVFKISIFK